MPEDIPDMTQGTETLNAVGTSVPGEVLEGVNGGIEKNRDSGVGEAGQNAELSPEALAALRGELTAETPDMAAIMNNPAIGPDGTLRVHGTLMTISEFIASEEGTTTLGEESPLDTGPAELSPGGEETSPLEQGPTPEEIQQMIEEELRKLVSEKVAELEAFAETLLTFSDEQIQSLTRPSGLSAGSSPVRSNGSSFNTEEMLEILEAIKDHTDLESLVAQLFPDLEKEATERVEKRIESGETDTPNEPDVEMPTDEIAIDEIPPTDEPDVADSSLAEAASQDGRVAPGQAGAPV